MARSLKVRLRGWRLYWKFAWRYRAGRRREALRLLWRGELDDARVLLARDRAPETRLQLACLELEAGDPAAAGQWLRELPDDPARAVLSQLIDSGVRRDPYREGGATSWLPAIVEAWTRAGSPDLHASPLLTHDFEKSHDTGKRGRCPDDDTRAIWMWIHARYGLFGRAKPRVAQRWAAASVDRPLPELVVALHLLDGVDELAPAYTRTLERLSELAPENLWIRIAMFVARRGAPYDRDAVRELASIVDARENDAALSPAVHQRFLDVAKAAGSGSPEPVALRGTFHAILVQTAIRLVTRIPKDANRDLADVAIRLGRRMREDRWLMTFLLGCALMQKGAAILDDKRAFAELAELNSERVTFANIDRTMLLDPLRWPLPSLSREVIAKILDGEFAYHRAQLRRELAARAKPPAAR